MAFKGNSFLANAWFRMDLWTRCWFLRVQVGFQAFESRRSSETCPKSDPSVMRYSPRQPGEEFEVEVVIGGAKAASRVHQEQTDEKHH